MDLRTVDFKARRISDVRRRWRPAFDQSIPLDDLPQHFKGNGRVLVKGDLQ
jgi:hypothetical protein